jgi:hypothetical protein
VNEKGNYVITGGDGAYAGIKGSCQVNVSGADYGSSGGGPCGGPSGDTGAERRTSLISRFFTRS